MGLKNFVYKIYHKYPKWLTIPIFVIIMYIIAVLLIILLELAIVTIIGIILLVGTGIILLGLWFIHDKDAKDREREKKYEKIKAREKNLEDDENVTDAEMRDIKKERSDVKKMLEKHKLKTTDEEIDEADDTLDSVEKNVKLREKNGKEIEALILRYEDWKGKYSDYVSKYDYQYIYKKDKYRTAEFRRCGTVIDKINDAFNILAEKMKKNKNNYSTKAIYRFNVHRSIIKDIIKKYGTKTEKIGEISTHRQILKTALDSYNTFKDELGENGSVKIEHKTILRGLTTTEITQFNINELNNVINIIKGMIGTLTRIKDNKNEGYNALSSKDRYGLSTSGFNASADIKKLQTTIKRVIKIQNEKRKNVDIKEIPKIVSALENKYTNYRNNTKYDIGKGQKLTAYDIINVKTQELLNYLQKQEYDVNIVSKRYDSFYSIIHKLNQYNTETDRLHNKHKKYIGTKLRNLKFSINSDLKSIKTLSHAYLDKKQKKLKPIRYTQIELQKKHKLAKKKKE